MPTATWEKTVLVGLIGNPNAGKSSIFNALTGGKAKVANYPGVTVEKMSGRFKIDDINIEIVDIPGLYTMTAMSRDEEIATAAIRGDSETERKANVMLIALDATNLERNLFFFSQVIELGIPMVAVLTMSDIVNQKGIEIEAEHNTPVTAILPGVVEYEGWVKGLGNILIVHHGGGFYSLSAHLFKSLKMQGAKVQQGETIGFVGDTGNSEKPSLYFEIRENGKAVDPLMYFSPRAIASLR